jgi:hypothetical protein
MQDDCHRSHVGPHRRIRSRRAAALAVMLAAFAAVAAGCGGGSTTPGVASLNTTTAAPSSSGASSGAGSQLAYSKCMRAHGVTNFPDPKSTGELVLEAHPGNGLDMNDPTFKSADQACKSLLPQVSPAQLAKQKDSALKYSKCMRDHGVKDFPDPNADGGLQIRVQPGSDLSPDSPVFKAADAACQHFMGDPHGGGGTNIGGGGKT